MFIEAGKPLKELLVSDFLDCDEVFIVLPSSLIIRCFHGWSIPGHLTLTCKRLRYQPSNQSVCGVYYLCRSLSPFHSHQC